MTTKNSIVQIDHAEFGLEEKKAAQIQAVFAPMLQKMVDLEDEYNEVIQLPMGFETSETAKELRLKYVSIRTETAKIHKETKAFYLNGGRFVDGWKNAQLFASEGIEDKLKNIEKHHELKEQARKDALEVDRLALLEPYEVETEHLQLGEMAEDLWENYFKGIQATDAQRKEDDEAAAKAEKAEKEAQAKKVERIERLSGMGMIWIDALDHYEKDGQSVTKDDVLLLSDKDFTAKVKAVAVELGKLKKKTDAEAAKQAEAEAKKETEAKRVATELAAKQAAEAKAAEVAKAAELAPDKAKLEALTSTITNLELPGVKSEEAQSIIDEVEMLLGKISNHITKRIEDL